ncbi:MAG: DUF6191 domain-containing protein [Cellulomonas sp.]
MGWLLLVCGVAALLVVIDRAVAALGARGHLPERSRRTRPLGSAGSGALGELIDVFQPGHRTLVAEQERQRLDIHQTPGEAPPFTIDLDAGVAVVDKPLPRRPAA